jgi:hypothetical protein
MLGRGSLGCWRRPSGILPPGTWFGYGTFEELESGNAKWPDFNSLQSYSLLLAWAKLCLETTLVFISRKFRNHFALGQPQACHVETTIVADRWVFSPPRK